MKVVLIKDVRNMGSKGSVLEVSSGHAINFLIPQKMAIPATGMAIATAELRQKQEGDKKAINEELLAQNVESLKAATITISMKANDKGHLYEAVDAAAIVAAVKAHAHIDLPEEAVHLEKPIKEVGTFEISVHAGKSFGSFPVTVEAE
jgi:large subunit ribosomal protein L9